MSRKNDEPLNINKGIELMLRRAKPSESTLKPKRGLGINNSFTLLKHKFYFNLELRWERR